MDWNREGLTWPHRALSQHVKCGGSQWHVQTMGPTELSDDEDAPVFLLLHGSGATTHSFADLMPLLAKRNRVVALDLPGHGFSQQLRSNQPTLSNVAQGVSGLLKELDVVPDYVVGHSAGAAVAVQMVVSGMIAPKALVSINGAFFPFPGFAGQLFPAAAKLLFLNPFVPRFFSFTAGTFGRVQSLIDSTGSKLSQKGLGYYETAIGSAHHVEGTLAMMASWDLQPMPERLRKLDIPVLQIIGSRDGTIKPEAAHDAAKLLKHGSLHIIKGKGHLVHEEVPGEVAELITAFVSDPMRDRAEE